MRVARFLLGAILSLAILAAAGYALRAPLAAGAVRTAMGSAGLESPKAKVSALSLDRMVLRDVSAGPEGGEGFSFEEVEVRYDWRTLLAERTVETVHAGQGVVRVLLAPTGAVSIPGVPRNGEAGERDREFDLPFSKLDLADITIIADTPEGEALGEASATFDAAQGGEAALRFETTRAGLGHARLEGAVLVIDVSLDADESVSVVGQLTGDLISQLGAVRDVDFEFDGALQSWRQAASGDFDDINGAARAVINSATVNIGDAPAASAMNAERAELIFGGPVSSVGVTGALELQVADGSMTMGIVGVPFTARADNGATMSITELSNNPLYRRTANEEAASLAFDVSGARISVSGTVDAERTDTGWFVVTPIRIGDYRSSYLSFEDASAVMRLATREGGLSADITTTSAVRALSIGRMSVFDAPLETNFLIDADYVAKTATVSLPPERCLELEYARLTIDQQDTEAELRDARLCDENGPLMTVGWAGDMESRFAANLAASNLQYRLGRTTIVGRSPLITVAGRYQPALNLTTAQGDISGGSLILNDLLIFSGSSGDFDFELNRRAMRTSARLATVQVSQNMETPMVAPVMAAGEVRLSESVASFDYALSTPAGVRLGTGTGNHNVTTARGQSRFAFDQIEFVSDGVQPDVLAPVLKGVIGETVGSATGEANFTWAPDPVGLSSAAQFELDDITFGGPTRVVTRTIGVNGQLGFSSLWPVATDGVQTINVSGVDFGALQLEEGEIIFEMPGDETLQIERAEFPWFGGLLGVYNASASLSGGEAVAPLRAENVDLALMLDYVDVDGLSGEGLLSGVLPLVVEDGKASIENGMLQSQGPGALRYQGEAADQASAAGQDAQIAFDILRDLRYSDLGVQINGPLDGRLQFQLKFEGTGEVALIEQKVRVPVLYRINLDAALLELLNQATLSQDIQLQIQRGLEDAQ